MTTSITEEKKPTSDEVCADCYMSKGAFAVCTHVKEKLPDGEVLDLLYAVIDKRPYVGMWEAGAEMARILIDNR